MIKKDNFNVKDKEQVIGHSNKIVLKRLSIIWYDFLNKNKGISI